MTQGLNRFSKCLQNGVEKKEVWSWALYDFANSGYTTVILTAVFNVYFVKEVAQGASWATLALTSALSLSYLLIMLSMPALGNYADTHAAKRKVLFTSTVACILATLLLSRSSTGDVLWALGFIFCSNYFYCMGESIIGAFLPELARPEAMARVSGWGWGFGYFGGMLTLGLSLAIVLKGEAGGLAATVYVPKVVVITAIIFAIATLPAFFWLKERTPKTVVPQQPWHQRLRLALQSTHTQFPEFRKLLWCGASYHAGISVVITLSAVYATEAMGFSLQDTMVLIFTVNIAAAVGALSFGHVQDRIGHRLALSITLWVWLLMVVLAVTATARLQFWMAAGLAGLAIGSSQSAGRAMVGVFAPKARLGEFFGLWTFAIQFAAMVGPLAYGLLAWLSAGNHRLALCGTGLFFVIGLAVLWRIDFSRAQQQREAYDASF